MNCSACGASVGEGGLFCQQCGKRLDVGAVPGESPTAESPAAAKETFQAAIARQDDSAHDPEHELWKGTYSWKAMIGWWVLASFATVALLVVSFLFPPSLVGTIPAIVLLWLGLLGCLLYRRLSVHFHLTSQRLVHNTGILVRATDRIEVIDMEDVTFFQGIVERMLGVGTIKITSQDRTHPEIWLVGIEEVQRISQLLDDVRRKERRRRGIQMVT